MQKVRKILSESNKLKFSLHCFREGARMFSIANIPDQTEYDRKLKDALQSNVSSVIMSLKESGQIAVVTLYTAFYTSELYA